MNVNQNPKRSVIKYDFSNPTFADVNHWHPLVNIASYKRFCVANCIGVKISQGAYLSEGALQTLQACEKWGLVVIGYHYGVEHVESFLKYFPPKKGRIPCLDFEGNNITVEQAVTWIDTIYKEWGRYPLFYSHSNWMNAGEPLNTSVAKCPYWGPQYGDHLTVPFGVGNPIAHQFTDGVSGPKSGPRKYQGIGMCDISQLLITANDLREIAELPPITQIKA